MGVRVEAMKVAVQHPANQVPDTGRTREEPFRVGGTWLVETVFDNVEAHYPDDGFLVVTFNDDQESVSWDLNDAEVVEGAEEEVPLLFGEPESSEPEDEGEEERETVEA